MVLNTSFDPFPTLKTERLLLRQLTIQDALQLYRLRTDERVMQYLDRPKLQSIEEAERFILEDQKRMAAEDGINWVISLHDNPLLIGLLGYWRMQKEHFRAEIGYTLLPKFHRRGIMQEAITAILDYAFEVMNLHSIEANVNPKNEASIRLLERNDFVREAYFRENYFYDGQFLDSAIYSLVKPK